ALCPFPTRRASELHHGFGGRGRHRAQRQRHSRADELALGARALSGPERELKTLNRYTCPGRPSSKAAPSVFLSQSQRSEETSVLFSVPCWAFSMTSSAVRT